MKTLRWIAAIVAIVLLAGACAAKNTDDAASEEEEGGSEQTQEPSSSDTAFGDLDEVCGEGDYTIKADEAGKSGSALQLAVANDRSSTIRPGLNKELWDASVAFSEWCNAQGGIGGLQIELVDADGELLEVTAAMTEVCNDAFMMVGGGWVQDNLVFSGQPESDFHECGMAAIPGFAVGPEFAEANGQIQPIPHPSAKISNAQFQSLAEISPDDAKSAAVVWGDLPAMQTISNQTVAIIEASDSELAGVFDYPVTGLPDWTPLAQQIMDSGATSFQFVGEPTNLGALVSKLREQGWEGTGFFETNAYDPVFLDSAGGAVADGNIIRSAFHPFEEASDWPAVEQYMGILDEYVPDHKENALLGMQSFSAWLLFATAANACAETSGGELGRDCILQAADDVEDWNGGGLHSKTQPSGAEGEVVACEMQMGIENGEFVRAFPEIGSEFDSGDGFFCPEDGVVVVSQNEGRGVHPPDRVTTRESERLAWTSS
jgi:ABC-type branched-subunit amino acid transport system substrate-binding protein